MSFYSWRQKMRYRLKAKSRHGVHSPFVYDFIEQVLSGNSRKAQPAVLPAEAGLNKKQQYLLEAIANRYRLRELVWDQRRFTLDRTADGILYLVTACDTLPGRCSENDIVLVIDPYKDAGRTKYWLEMAGNRAVPLSVDVFEMGILFFKNDFKVKQHFILKYR